MSICDSDSGLSVSVDGSHCGVTSGAKIEVKIPDMDVKRTLSVSPTETIGSLKKHLLNSLSSDLKDTMNFGLFIPPTAGKAGKFLLEERTLKEYGLYQDHCSIELRYKRRLYRTANINVARLKKLHSKANLKAFMEYVGSGDVAKVMKMLNKGLDPNYQLKDTGETPLIRACSLSKPGDLIKALVEGGAHLDFRHSNGHTPIHAAAILGNLEAVKILLDLGQSPNTLDMEGLTPLYHCTISNTGVACAERLLFDYSILGIEDDNGLQEIHQACRFGRVQHLELLLQYSADLNSQTSKNGNTPLHICAYLNQESCARLLLFRGADRTIMNRSGHTAYHQALLSDNKSLALLIQHYKDEDVVPLRASAKYNDKRRGTLSQVAPIHRSRSAGGLSDQSRPEIGLDEEDDDQALDPFMLDRARTRTRSIGGGMPSNERPSNGDVCSLFSAKRFSRSFHDLTNKIPPSHPGPVEPDQSTNCWAPDWDVEDITDAASSVSGPSQRKTSRNKSRKDSDFKSRSHSYSRRSSRGDIPSLAEIDTRFLPRMVVLQRNSQGFGFVIRGLKASSGFSFVPTLRNPALQYFEEVEPGSVAARAGILKGDYILEINKDSVVFASHEETVRLIKASGDILAMKVVSVNKGHSKKKQREYSDDSSSMGDASDISSIMSSEAPCLRNLSTFTRSMTRPSGPSSTLGPPRPSVYGSTPHYKSESTSKPTSGLVPSMPLTGTVTSITSRVQRSAQGLPGPRPESISSMDSLFPMPPPPGGDFCPREPLIEEEGLGGGVEDRTLRRVSNHAQVVDTAYNPQVAPPPRSCVPPPAPPAPPPPPPCGAPPAPLLGPPKPILKTPKPILKTQQTLPAFSSGFDDHLRDAIAKRRQKMDSSDQASVASMDSLSSDDASRHHIRTTLSSLKQNNQQSRSQSNRWTSTNASPGTNSDQGTSASALDPVFQRTHSEVFSSSNGKGVRKSEDGASSRLYLI